MGYWPKGVRPPHLIGVVRSGPNHHKSITPGVLPPIRQVLELQAAAKLTDEALANAVGYTPATITHLRKGNNSLSLRALINYAEYFNYEVRLVPKEPENGQQQS